MVKKPWQGRFEGTTSKLMEEFSESVSFDQRLYPFDIRGSIAHARMLGEKGIIPRKDADTIIKGLETLLGKLDDGLKPWDISYEDVHMNIEAALKKEIGDDASKLHTARSRNDQVALDLRMFVKEASLGVAALTADLMAALLDRAEGVADAMMPGYTHLQRAQPVLLSHHLMAYFEMFRRDHSRFSTIAGSLIESPLGSGALAGTPHPIDREMTASELGFDSITRNSMDAVSDRDFVAEFLFACSLCQLHLSRLSEEIIMWASPEFSFVELPEEYSTGSSMMPQKKNPDSAELIRGKSGRVIGNLTSLLVILKGLPLAYNRDLQEDKEPLFDSFDTLVGSLKVMTGLLFGLTFDLGRMAETAGESFSTATDLADYLVEKGVAFREAHEITGKIVKTCIEKNYALADMPSDEMKSFSDVIGDDIYEAISVEASISKRNNPGGTAPGRVKQAMEEAREHLGSILKR